MSTSLATSVVEACTSALTTMRAASTDSTTPSRLATTVTPESRATMASMPVPTSGASVRRSGTAWRCMFEPIRARLASSFSRKGISEAATETSWFGDTSIRSTLVRPELDVLALLAGRRRRCRVKLPFLSTWALAWAMVCFSSSSAE